MRLLDWFRRWLASVARPPFKRTVCACKDCCSFCKTKPGALIPSDVPRIARRLVELRLIDREENVTQFLRATSPTTIHDRDTGVTGEAAACSWTIRIGVKSTAFRPSDAHISMRTWKRPKPSDGGFGDFNKSAPTPAYLALRGALPLAEGGKNEY